MLTASNLLAVTLPFREGATPNTYLAFFGLGALIALALTPGLRRLALRWGVVDNPLHRKTHSKPTPLLGGVAVMLGMWLPILFFWFYNADLAVEMMEGAEALLLTLGAGLAMMLVGLIDDRIGLKAHQKFLGQFPVAIVLVLLGVQIKTVTIPGIGVVDLGIMGSVLSVLWIVGITNALNLVDGLDGVAAGVAFYAAFTNGVLAILNQNLILALVMWSLAGSCIGFLRYNFHPARIFLGDGGSLFLGATLAVGSIVCQAKGPTAISVVIPVLVAGYPILDTLLAMGRRAARGKPMFTGDASHIHHRLIAKGMDQTRAAMVIYTVCAVLSCGAIALALHQVFAAALALGFLSVVLILGLWYLGYLNYFRSHAIQTERNRFRATFHLAEASKAEIALTQEPPELFDALETACRRLHVVGLELRPDPGAAKSSSRLQSFLPKEIIPARSDNEPPYAVETHRFPQVGLRVNVRYPTDPEHGELALEQRALMGEILKVAVDRVGKGDRLSQRSNGNHTSEAARDTSLVQSDPKRVS